MLAPSPIIDEQSIVAGLTENPLSFTVNQFQLLGDFFSLKLRKLILRLSMIQLLLNQYSLMERTLRKKRMILKSNNI